MRWGTWDGVHGVPTAAQASSIMPCPIFVAQETSFQELSWVVGAVLVLFSPLVLITAYTNTEGDKAQEHTELTDGTPATNYRATLHTDTVLE